MIMYKKHSKIVIRYKYLVVSLKYKLNKNRYVYPPKEILKSRRLAVDNEEIKQKYQPII